MIIKDLIGGNSEIIIMPAVEDDPQRRKPDITRAMTYLNWKPKVYFIYNIVYLVKQSSKKCIKYEYVVQMYWSIYYYHPSMGYTIIVILIVITPPFITTIKYNKMLS